MIQLCAYVLRNPVAARLITGAKKWPWSSYLLNSGARQADWFNPQPLWDELGVDPAKAARAVAALLRKDQPPLESRGQLCYGGDGFAADLAKKLTCSKRAGPHSTEHPCRTLAVLSPAIARYDERYDARGEAMSPGLPGGHHSRSDVARF